jgi:hypothetical protein
VIRVDGAAEIGAALVAGGDAGDEEIEHSVEGGDGEEDDYAEIKRGGSGGEDEEGEGGEGDEGEAEFLGKVFADEEFAAAAVGAEANDA